MQTRQKSESISKGNYLQAGQRDGQGKTSFSPFEARVITVQTRDSQVSNAC